MAFRGRGARGGFPGGFRGSRGYWRNPENGRPPFPRSRYSHEASGASYNASMGYKKLFELATKDSTEILKTFAEQNKLLENTLNSNIESDNLVLMIRCVAKICDLDVFLENKTKILLQFCHSKFINNLEVYFKDLPYCAEEIKWRNSLFWKDMERFWLDVFKYYNCIINVSQTTAIEKLTTLINVNKRCIEILRIDYKEQIPIRLSEELDDILNAIAVTKKRDDIRASSNVPDDNRDEEDKAPDDFRKMSVIPTAEEIVDNSKVFLRPNIINGAFKSAEHYLDVQFRLLREDYVSPLRESIQQYIQDPNKKRYDGGRFYKNIRFQYYIITDTNFGILVNFGDRRKKVNMKKFHGRFLFGALLCFSSDDFKTIIFGTVIERSDELLAASSVIVELLDPDVDKSIFERKFVMFESNVYFPQYGPPLNILKSFKGEVPMGRYIVNMEKSTLPSHVEDKFKIEEQLVDIENEDEFKDVKFEYLDDSQENAFKMALSRDFIAIQGPPGTGKTYMGLKIVKTLLDNLDKSDLPILVLCYTNHALDQFLEGILEKTKEIVRIGGQSKHRDFGERYNLRSLRGRKMVYNPYSEKIRTISSEASLIRYYIEMVDNLEVVADMFDKYLPVTQISKISNIYEWLMIAEDLTYLKSISDYRCKAAYKNYKDFIENKGNDATIYDSNDSYNIDGEIFNSRKIDRYSCKSLTTLRLQLKELNREIHTSESEFASAKENYSDFLTKENEMNGSTFIKSSEQHQYRLSSAKSRHEISLRKFDMKLRELAYFEEHLLAYDEDQHYTDFVTMKDKIELSCRERWSTYFCWKKQLKPILVQRIHELGESFIEQKKLYDEANSISDLQLLKDLDVVGVTTTGAALRRELIQALKPSIVVVEEAAEVLESHIVVNLSNNCKHLILIGDHQQLRPTTASYRMSKKFNLDISLFERTFNSSVNVATLNVQHRMRPEIANLITPSIYNELINHESVLEYPNMLGVKKNLFFVHHEMPEQEDEAINSKMNDHEANFVVSLAKYFIQQGYHPKEITILVAYSGQFFAVRELQRNMPITNGVKICILDGYQGEENKIILLSLVRSNAEGSVGFLKIPNRVCVALSRAKEGMYIIGNMKLLENKSELWKTVKQTLIEQESYGEHLELRCERHNTTTNVASASDFQSVPEGGCLVVCGTILACEHTCQSSCHFFEDHDDYKCKQQCKKYCKMGHKCSLKCFEDCKCFEIVTKLLPCGHEMDVPCYLEPDKAFCPIPIDVTLPLCSHVVNVSCFQRSMKIACIFPCEIRLPCGHGCTMKCHMDEDPEHLKFRCEKPCENLNKDCSVDHPCLQLCYQDCITCPIEMMKKRQDCSHKVSIACHKDPNENPCMEKCVRMMNCGHHCTKKCSESCTDCAVKVDKERKCGHILKVKCSENVDKIPCDLRCNLILQCGHRCYKKCGEVCDVKKCKDFVKSPYESLCGHDIDIPCQLIQNGLDSRLVQIFSGKYCKEPCNAILIGCDHRCKAKCGTCQNRLHAPCSEPCGNILICGHSCNKPCREACNICDKLCEIKCIHNKCGRKCGIPCVPCKERCPLGCKHQQCKKKCGDICNIDPCMESCHLNLMCGHKCRGLCGDKCPNICKECDPDNFPEIFFGDEDDEDSRFVTLVDCGHSVEVNGLNKWINVSGVSESKETALKMPECPYCKKLIMNTPRYSNFIKSAFEDMQTVKKKMYGNMQDIIAKLKEVESTISDLNLKNLEHVESWKSSRNMIFKHIKKININKFEKDIQKNKRMINLNLSSITTLLFKATLLKNIQEMFVRQDVSKITTVLTQLEFLCSNIVQSDLFLSEQLIQDYNNELLRLKILVELTSCGTTMNTDCRMEVLHKLFGLKSISEDDKEYFSDVVKKHRGITVEEKKMIIKAIGLRKGHWYKCPEGHVYCIGECGGAMECSKCPECGANIGGQNHRLDSTNSVATEMDGATHSAYSEAATQEFLIREGLVPMW